MNKIVFILIFTLSLISCRKECGECFVVEFEPNGTDIKSESSLGEFCGKDVKEQASQKAISEGYTCTVCQIQCR